MTTPKIDQKAYLQKYLSGPSQKKKKKKATIKGKGLKIIDDDIDISKMRALDDDELDILAGGEDAPQIAGIIDERPEDIKKMEEFKTNSKWRVINQDDGFNSKLQIEEIKKNVVENQESDIIFGKMYSDPEDDENDSRVSPARRESTNGTKNSQKDEDFSPPRRKDQEYRKNRDKNNSDSDISPPRKNQVTSRTNKPSRWGYFENEEKSDISSQRSRNSEHRDKKHRPVSESPSKNQLREKGRTDYRNRDTNRSRNDSDSDISPPRKQRSKKPNSNLSPPKNRRKSPERRARSDSDTSPPRKNRRKSAADRRAGSDSDTSPPRKKRKSPQRKKTRNDSDVSPPRNRPPERKRTNSDSDLSPPRKNRRKTPERKTADDSDISPPRNRTQNYSRDSPPPSNKKMAKTLEGKKAGLSSAKQLRQENESFRRREDDMFKNMSEEVSGRYAQAVSRKIGIRETSEERRKKKEKVEKQKEMDEKYKKWGKGLKQLEDQDRKVKEYLHEANKPLARHRNDRDLEDHLRQQERQGDPMLDYVRDKKRSKGELQPERPIYKGNFPPNRFNIRPGYRWDGVDRSSGYEKKYFDQQSKRKAQEEEAYKWSTEDL